MHLWAALLQHRLVFVNKMAAVSIDNGLRAADQSLVHCGRRKRKIAVHSIAIDPVRPHLFVTGGEDQFGVALGAVI